MKLLKDKHHGSTEGDAAAAPRRFRGFKLRKMVSRFAKYGIMNHLKREAKMSDSVQYQQLAEIGEAKKFFQLGVIVAFCLTRHPMHSGKWVVSMRGKDWRVFTLVTKQREVKLFSSIDTAVGQIEQIAGREAVSFQWSL